MLNYAIDLPILSRSFIGKPSPKQIACADALNVPEDGPIDEVVAGPSSRL
jgi:hypothetical protein